MITNEEVEKVFEHDHFNCPSYVLEKRIKLAILEELPKILPLEKLDSMQWDYVYGQINIMVADALQMKYRYMQKDKEE